MSFSLSQILLFNVAYLSGLFAVAYLSDNGVIPRRITHHPAVYVLSLGVFAGVMATNGVMALAVEFGYGFLLYYAGVVVVFIFAPLLLMPLLRLCRVYQLTSLADVLTFRFRSAWVGAAIAVAMCLTLLPLLALQIQAVAESINILAGGTHGAESKSDRAPQLALLFCIIITVFSMLFGTRHRAFHERNTGLVAAIAFESIVKLSAMLILMFAALYQVFGGFAGLESWLLQNPQVGRQLHNALEGDTARTLLLVFFAATVCMPHFFHMAFAENNDSMEMRTATWGLPLYLLLLAVPVLPIVWASTALGPVTQPEYSGLALGMALQSVPLSAAAFIASLSAASVMIIVTTLALANMCLAHLLIPVRLPQTHADHTLYASLRWSRRILIAALILGAYVLYMALADTRQLTEIALVAFAGTLQFLPGLVATPFWPRGNRTGLLWGLLVGLSVWCVALLLPLIGLYDPAPLNELFARVSGVENNAWAAATLVAIFANSGLFIALSLLTRTRKSERVAAEICSMDARARPQRRTLTVAKASDFRHCLSPVLGDATAVSEVDRALDELQFTPDEDRPYALRRLRARIEANLSSLLGPSAATRIIESRLPFEPGHSVDSGDLHLIERDIDQTPHRLTGMAADIDELRRHHRTTLDKLPVGACSLGADGEILMWNRSMEDTTGVRTDTVIGSRLNSIPSPWNTLLTEFREGADDTVPRAAVDVPDQTTRYVSLHRAPIDESGDGDTVILVEDITDYEMLESELLHSERLASIGRLAAGIAHEIGNPVTGIACLAQNLEYEDDPREIRFMAQDILKQTERVTRIVESLMNFSHTGGDAGELVLAPANLADCVDEAIHLLSLDREAKATEFRNHCDRELVVSADTQRLLQVFVNLLANARDACDEYGEIDIRAEADEHHVVAAIEDNGCGIAAEQQDKVFEPFFTTKDPGEGTGLGLALVYSIMEDMNGKVHITSPIQDGPRPGTRVSLTLQRTSYGSELQGV